VSVEIVKATSLEDQADQGLLQESPLMGILGSAAVPEETVQQAVEPAPAEVATISKAQASQLTKASGLRLHSIGKAALMQQLVAVFGIESIQQLPADHFSAVMESLQNEAACERWNAGRDSRDNSVILNEEDMAQLAAKEAAPEPAQEKAASKGTSMAPVESNGEQQPSQPAAIVQQSLDPYASAPGGANEQR
jgi:5'-3' exonuclease